MAYSAEHLFKLATAFELLGLGLPALTATTLVERHWAEFSAAYALAQVNANRWHFNRRVYARLILRSMHELQFSQHVEPVKSSSVIVEDHEHLSWIFESDRSRSAFIYPVVISSGILARLTKMAQEFAGVSRASMDQEILQWLPKGSANFLLFKGVYPDRANLPARRHLHALFGNDADSELPDGVEEARAFSSVDDEEPTF